MCVMCNRISQGRKRTGGRDGQKKKNLPMDRQKKNLPWKQRKGSKICTLYTGILQKASVPREAISHIGPLFLSMQLAIFGETFLHREQLKNSSSSA